MKHDNNDSCCINLCTLSLSVHIDVWMMVFREQYRHVAEGQNGERHVECINKPEILRTCSHCAARCCSPLLEHNLCTILPRVLLCICTVLVFNNSSVSTYELRKLTTRVRSQSAKTLRSTHSPRGIPLASTQPKPFTPDTHNCFVNYHDTHAARFLLERGVRCSGWMFVFSSAS